MRMIVKVGIDSTEYAAGLKKMESGLASVGKTIAGAFSIGVVTNFIRTVANAAGEIADLSDQLNITTDEVQRLQAAADRSGVSFDKYASALSKVRKLQADAAAGDKSAKDKFKAAGIDPSQGSFSILQQLGALPDEQAFEILDAKSARLKKSLSDLGKLPSVSIISEEDVNKIDRAQDGLASIWRLAKALAAKPIAGLAGLADPNYFRDDNAWRKHAALKVPTGRFKARDTGEMFGPTAAEAQIQAMNNANRVDQFSTLEDLGKMNASKRFSPINLGDRANVGGFFGPNADVNRKMQQNIESMNNEIKAISKVVVSTAQTAP